MKCRAKKEMKNAKAITMKNGRRQPRVFALSVAPRCSKLVKPRDFPDNRKKNTAGWIC
jgi:hypothetical protein